MKRSELRKDIAFARVRLGMSREEFMRQTPAEWADIQQYLYDQLTPEQKALLPSNEQQTPEEMMAVMATLGS